MNSDNPVNRLINETLGLGSAPKSFSDKMDGLRRELNLPDAEYIDLFRKDPGLEQLRSYSSSRPTYRASDPDNLRAMYKGLSGRGLIPKSAEAIFKKAGLAAGDSIYYNGENASLFYRSGNVVTPLPVRSGMGGVRFGNATRKANSLMTGDVVTPYIDEYYKGIASSSKHSVAEAVKEFTSSSKNVLLTQGEIPRADLSNILLDGTSVKGINTPEEAFWTSRRSILDMPSNKAFQKSFNQFQLYSSSFSMLAKTAGRVINPQLQAITGKIDHREAFKVLEGYKKNYISSLSAMLLASDAPSSFVFTKPGFLGHEEGKFLISSPQLTKMFGGDLEKHTLDKGLFQLAKLKHTDSGLARSLIEQGMDPTAPYVIAGESRGQTLARLKLKVGIVDTANDAVSRLLFQEGGAILGKPGIAMFAQNAPMGDLSFSSPSEKLITSVEDVFGINLGAGNVQTFDWSPTTQLGKAKTEDLKRILKASGNQRGLARLLAVTDNRLAKVELTDSTLKLSFVTPNRVTPATSEINIAARRFAATKLNDFNKLANSGIPEDLLESVHVWHGADEYLKNHGPDVFITNFIEKVKGRDDAEVIFRKAFGHAANISINGKTRMVVPEITSVDHAYRNSKLLVLRMLRGGTDEEKTLAATILKGNKVVTDKMLKSGITGVTVIGMGGASRTDFMGDINMMNPVTISPTKMTHIAAGARQLGYDHLYQDPMYSLLAGSNKSWNSGDIRVLAGSGQLHISDKHIMSRYAKALYAKPGHIDPSAIVTLNKGGGFSIGGKPLRALPTDFNDFSHAKGVDFSRLEGTILGQKQDMLYLDLGKERQLDLLGSGKKSYRYLPIPLDYLRVKEGLHNRLIIGKKNPTRGIVQSLVDIDSNRDFYKDVLAELENTESKLGRQMSQGFFSLNKSIAGKEGIFQKSNTILMPLGARTRLTPQSGSFFDMASLDDASKLYTSVMSSSDFEDYLARKSGTGKGVQKQISKIKELVKKQGHFYAMVSVDPMQRAEHANLMRIRVDPTIPGSAKIGQLNMAQHPFWYLLSERDTDRDAASIVPLSGMSNTGLTDEQINSLLEDRWLRQQKLSKHFMWFYKHQLLTGSVASAEDRFSLLKKGLVKAKNAINHIPTYLGISESLGYSTVRASEDIMSNLIAYDVRGARLAGVKHSTASDEMLKLIRAPYANDKVRAEIARKAYQNIYQSPVVKAGKDLLGAFDAALIDIGHKYKGTAFDYDKVVSETADAFYDLLAGSGKVRSFTETEYLYNNFPKVKSSMDLMKADLERGAEYAKESGKKAKEQIFRATSQLMGEMLGGGQVLAASQSMPKGVNSIIQSIMRPETTQAVVESNVLRPALGLEEKNKNSQKVVGALQDTGGRMPITDGDASESMMSKATKYFNSSKGRTFGAGIGIGALVGAGIVSSMSGPEAPMPRDVDGRQPTDRAPDVYSTPPRIYGNHQSFSASKQGSPTAIPNIGAYQFPSFGNSSITIRDRSSSSNPRMIERHMRDISNSDYTY